MKLDLVDTSELVDRYNFLVEEYVKLAKELAPKLEKFGKYKKELQIITVELIEKRNKKLDDPKGLKDQIESEIKKRDVKSQTDKNEGCP